MTMSLVVARPTVVSGFRSLICLVVLALINRRSLGMSRVPLCRSVSADRRTLERQARICRPWAVPSMGADWRSAEVRDERFGSKTLWVNGMHRWREYIREAQRERPLQEGP